MKSVTKAQLRWMSTYIAMVVRNEMEDFHYKHLNDAQMKELNPIIRDAVYTALYAANDTSAAAKLFIQFQILLIPDYWEEPKLTKEFKDLESEVGNHAEVKPAPREKPKATMPPPTRLGH